MILGRNKSDTDYIMKKTNSDGSINTILLTESEAEKDLGVHIDNNLNFKEHIEKTTARANKIVGVIRRTFDFLTEGVFVQLFNPLMTRKAFYIFL